MGNKKDYNMDFGPLNGKTALITGAAKRIGAAVALALARRGVHVVLHYNRAEKEAAHLAYQITEFGGKASTVQADLTQTGAAEAVVGQALRLTGHLDYLINNASIFDEMSFSDTTAAAIQENMTVNAIMPFLLSRCFAAQGRSGTIIHMLDTMVMDYDKKHLPYHLSKRTLHALTSVMAIELAPSIRVNAVAPGLILPPQGKGTDYLEQLASSNPLKRYGGTEDIAQAVLYLLCAEFVTGQTLYVDGGRHLRGRMYE